VRRDFDPLDQTIITINSRKLKMRFGTVTTRSSRDSSTLAMASYDSTSSGRQTFGGKGRESVSGFGMHPIKCHQLP